MLNLNNFIKNYLIEEVKSKKLLPIYPGTKVDFNGATWEAVKQDTAGWVWKVIRGKNPNHNPNIITKLFGWESPIYDQERYNQDVVWKPKERSEPKRLETELSFPPGVVDAKTAFDYSLQHPENKDIEYFIAKDPKYSYRYAREVKNGEFVKGEPAILTEPILATKYAINILKRRWLEAEPIIQTDYLSWINYKRAFHL